MQQRQRIIAFWMLLVFALGGVMGPLVHDLAHGSALNGDRAAVVDSDDAVASPTPSDLLDCELCEVLVKATTESQDRTAAILPMAQRHATAAPALHGDTSFSPQSRAPPLV